MAHKLAGEWELAGDAMVAAAEEESGHTRGRHFSDAALCFERQRETKEKAAAAFRSALVIYESQCNAYMAGDCSSRLAVLLEAQFGDLVGAADAFDNAAAFLDAAHLFPTRVEQLRVRAAALRSKIELN